MGIWAGWGVRNHDVSVMMTIMIGRMRMRRMMRRRRRMRTIRMRIMPMMVKRCRLSPAGGGTWAEGGRGPGRKKMAG